MARSPKILLKFNNTSAIFNKLYYDHLRDYSNFTEIHYGGASSGKSHGVVQKAVMKACDSWDYPRKILFTRKVGRSIKDSIFEDVKSCLSDFKLLDRCKINHTDFRITLPNGSVFLFKGMDNPEKIKSIKGLSDVVIEEATEFTLDDYTQLTLRLRERRHKNRQIFLMFNPVSKLNWVYKAFFEEGSHHERVKIYQSTYKDNHFLDEENRGIIEDLANRNPAYYRIYALGEFATLDKLIFPKYKKVRLNPNGDELRLLPSHFGLDFGYNDPAAFIHVKIDEEKKRIYFIDEFVEKGLLSGSLYRKIDEFGYRKEVIIADCARPETIAELKKLGISRIRGSKKGKDSVIHGLQYLLQYELIVDDRCVKLIEEMENYTWKKDKKTGEYMDQPIDCYNHVIDATRYALEDVWNKRGIKVNLFKGGI